MTNVVHAHEGRKYAVVDVSDNSTTVYAGKCKVWGVYINTALSAHALPIQDSTTVVFTLVASLAAGNYIPLYGATFDTSLVVDPNDAATGNITIVYEPATDQ